MPSEGEPVIRVHVDVGALEAAKQTRVKMDQADHVEAVVLERRFEKIKRAGAKEVEIGVGHQGAGQRIVAFVAQDALLDITQRARFEAMPVQRANEGQQVDMRGMRELARHARHHPTRAQHRKVERPSVESRHPSGRLELLTQGMQKRRFHPRLR